MPGFTALMSREFGPEDPFNALVQNDRITEEGDVRVLPLWVADRLEADLHSRQIAR